MAAQQLPQAAALNLSSAKQLKACKVVDGSVSNTLQLSRILLNDPSLPCP